MLCTVTHCILIRETIQYFWYVHLVHDKITWVRLILSNYHYLCFLSDYYRTNPSEKSSSYTLPLPPFPRATCPPTPHNLQGGKGRRWVVGGGGVQWPGTVSSLAQALQQCRCETKRAPTRTQHKISVKHTIFSSNCSRSNILQQRRPFGTPWREESECF